MAGPQLIGYKILSADSCSRTFQPQARLFPRHECTQLAVTNIPRVAMCWRSRTLRMPHAAYHVIRCSTAYQWYLTIVYVVIFAFMYIHSPISRPLPPLIHEPINQLSLSIRIMPQDVLKIWPFRRPPQSFSSFGTST